MSRTTPEGANRGRCPGTGRGQLVVGGRRRHAWPPPVKPIRGQLLHLRAPSRIASRDSLGQFVLHRALAQRDDARRRDGRGRRVRRAAHRTMASAISSTPRRPGAVDRERRIRGRAGWGLRPKTPDELPIIGPSSTMPHVFHATGHYRNGILLTPLTAELVADLVLDRREHRGTGADESGSIRVVTRTRT